MGIELRIVSQDLEHGHEFIPGLPPLKPIDIVQHGGILDTLTRTIVAPSQDPVIWYAGPRQAEVIQRRDDVQTRILAIAAEGGGKTVLGAQWLIWQIVLDVMLGLPGPRAKPVTNLVTAPTYDRLQLVFDALGDRIPIVPSRQLDAEGPSNPWGTLYVDKWKIVLPCGHQIKGLSTKPQAAATGSAVQGVSARRSLDDELQDSVDLGADPNIEARLRGHKVTYRFCTASQKNSSTWRAWRDWKLTLKDWKAERLIHTENPFEWAERWETFARGLSKRDFERRILCKDVGPERMVYTSWERDEVSGQPKNILPRPLIGARDITAKVTGGYEALYGFDPGNAQDVGVLLKCFEIRGQRQWWVIDELTTRDSTLESHIHKLTEKLQREHGLQFPGRDQPKVMVRCDPQGNTDTKTDVSVYTAFRNAGYTIKSAAYTQKGLPQGRVPKDPAIEMVNGLLLNVLGERRLFIDCDEHRRPVAPDLVTAIENSERNEKGEAEVKVKNKPDYSHWCAALRYALWQYERLRLDRNVNKQAEVYT